MNTLKFTCNPDGSIRLDARGMEGSEKEILDELSALATEAGGELMVEKHERHRHGHVHRHVHARGGRS